MSIRNLAIVLFLVWYLGGEVVALPNDRVCFALITDMHIQQKDSKALAGLKACVEQINHCDSVDYVFVAGDLVQQPDSMSMWQCKEALDKLDIPYFVVAGNHDRSYKGKPDTTFHLVFQQDVFCFSDSLLTFMGFSLYRQQGESQPRLSDITWACLDSMLGDQLNVKPMIVVTHEPLVEGDCGNARSVIKWLSKHHTLLVLSGHYHRYMVYDYDGIPGIVNRALRRTNEEVAAYTQYVIKEGVVYIYECYVGREPELWLSLPLDYN